MKIINCLFYILFSLTIGLLVAFICLTSLDIAIWKDITGVSSGILASLTVSLAVVRLEKLKTIDYGDKFRTITYSKLKRNISNFLCLINGHEEVLSRMIGGIKRSFAEYDIDMDNIENNYFIFIEYEKRINEFVNDDKKAKSIINHIDTLLMRDTFDKDVKQYNPYHGDSKLYNCLVDIKLECEKLEGTLEQYNIQYKEEIFSASEINLIHMLSDFTYLSRLQSFVFPKMILSEIKNVVSLNKFIKADYVPNYQKPNFLDIIQSLSTMSSLEKESKEWIDAKSKLAKEFVDSKLNKM